MTAQLTAEGARPVVVIDPDAIVTSNELEAAFGDAAVYSVRDWFELRQAWELHGRHPDGHGPRVVIVTHELTVGSPVDLPSDIEQASDVRRVRIPGPSTVRAALVDLDDEASFGGTSTPLGGLQRLVRLAKHNAEVRHIVSLFAVLCDEPAHACARSRRHDTDLVVARVEQMIDAWFARD